ncbi:MAG: sigma-70 family RNA polymerase sigma factor [Bacteroidota bacterium]|nr:sigma-70 family RNA polymerase sigma factor [Bacteroidota bacterium]
MKSASTLSDRQLIDLYVGGDVEALSRLINRHKDRIYTSIYLMIKDKYQAEDIFQDAFIKVIDSIKAGHYNDEGKFSQWVMRIAHNLCFDHFRKIKRSPIIKSSDNSNIYGVIHNYQVRADEKMIKLQSDEKVRQLLDLLPENQREIIVMRHYAELSFKEIAKITNCSINTALGRMRYGLMNVRKMIDEKQLAL